jgi:hypothetical protein
MCDDFEEDMTKQTHFELVFWFRGRTSSTSPSIEFAQKSAKPQCHETCLK